MIKLSDCWQTPQWLFKELDREFDFDVDLCATAENSKCDIYGTDYLCDEYISKTYSRIFSRHTIGRDWLEGETCFMNPPYSNPRPFIEKAWEDSKRCKIVCLVKCDPSTKWWATFWDYDCGPKPGCEVRFFPKRIKFDPPSGVSLTGS